MTANEIDQLHAIPLAGRLPRTGFQRFLRKPPCTFARMAIIRPEFVYFIAMALDKPLWDSLPRRPADCYTFEKLDESEWGAFPSGHSEDHSQVFIR